jgi:hypothetical protein
MNLIVKGTNESIGKVNSIYKSIFSFEDANKSIEMAINFFYKS